MTRTSCSRALLALLPGVAFAGCSGPQAFMAGDGPAARLLAQLGWFAMIVFLLAIVGTLIVLVWAVVRRRGSLAEHAPPDLGGGQRWILVGGFLIPTFVLTVVFVLTLWTLTAVPRPDDANRPADITVVGRQWWWEAIYQIGLLTDRVHSPTEIHVPVGRPVVIDLESRDVIHSFWVPRLHGKVDVVPGRTNRIVLQADRPGVYRGQCAEYCGMQHAHMILMVVARPEAEFYDWLSHQRRPAAAPVSDDAARGRELFMTRACVNCHMVRGTKALATVGPDLTHVGSRRLIAGGMLENNLANMHAWVTHAQSIKPGSAMPSLTDFTGEELQQLVAYLRELR